MLASNALKNALQHVKQAKTMRIEAQPRIENLPHDNALNAITQSASDLDKELSITMKRRVRDSDSDDDEDDDDDDGDDDSSDD